MNSTNRDMWTIDKIVCSEWDSEMSFASVWASNWSSDEISFQIAIHPDAGVVTYNHEYNFYSDSLDPFLGETIISNELLPLAEQILDNWWAKVVQLKGLVSPKKWKTSPGLPVSDSLYAGLALLYAERKKMNPLKVTTLLSEDMNIPLSTAKERVRKARDKDFLTSPGKGLNGQGDITEKAIKLLKKEGLF